MEGRATTWGLRIWVLLVLGFLLLPIVLIMIYAFNPSTIQSWPISGFTLRWFSLTLKDPQVQQAFLLSIKAGLAATVIALIDLFLVAHLHRDLRDGGRGLGGRGFGIARKTDTAKGAPEDLVGRGGARGHGPHDQRSHQRGAVIRSLLSPQGPRPENAEFARGIALYLARRNPEEGTAPAFGDGVSDGVDVAGQYSRELL